MDGPAAGVENRIPRGRAGGEGARGRARADPPIARGCPSAAPRLSAGWGAALAAPRPFVSSVELALSLQPKFHVDPPAPPRCMGPGGLESGGRRRPHWGGPAMVALVWRAAGANVRRLGSVTGEARVVGKRLLKFRAGRVVLCRCAARARDDPKDEKQERNPRHRFHPRRVAPVFLETSATILAIAASISASVRVRSRGRKVTLIATDFVPSGSPMPW